MLEQKFNNEKNELEQLFKSKIIKLNENDFIKINFLDEQYDLLSKKRKKRQEAGKIGGEKKSSNAKAMLKQNSSYKDKDKEKDKEYKTKAKKNKPKTEAEEKELLEFDKARKKYIGTKAGNETEFGNFKKKHNDYEQVLPLLLAAIEKEIKYKAYLTANTLFCPPWKNFQTWINKRCWENEFTVALTDSKSANPYAGMEKL